MREKTGRRREAAGNNPSSWDAFQDPGGESGPPVTVAHGPYAEALPVGGLTVGEIRSRYRDRFDIDPESQAWLDSEEAGEQVVVRSGQHLEFRRHAGVKGGFPKGRSDGPRHPREGRL